MRAVLIDDHGLIRDAMRRLLTEDFHFDHVVEAEDLDSALDLLSRCEPVDLIVVDLNMPGSAGPESLRALVEGFSAARILVMSGSEAKQDVLGCLEAGVDGYLPKSLPVSEMVAAIAQVLAGAVYVPRALTRRGMEAPSRPARVIPAVENLTGRQREVLDELLLGRPSKEIARSLGVAEGTIKIHLAAIYRALGVRTRAEAISKMMGASR
jgi:DNA-binding NarL/FixJ family response regulator